MTNQFTHLEAIRRLAQGLPLEACTISGPLLLGEEPLGDGQQTVRRPLTFRGVEVQELITACVVFEAPVRLVDCVIQGTTFYAAYSGAGWRSAAAPFSAP